MRLILHVSSGPSAGRRILLNAGQALQVGRTEYADFAVPDDQISSVHFAVEAAAAGCFVKDLKSRNGTYLNGARIAERTELRHGDEIRAGRTTFAVHDRAGGGG